MRKPKVQTIELFQTILSLTEAYETFEAQLKSLRKKRMIAPDAWREKVLPARTALAGVLDDAWHRLHKKASSHDFPELIREDVVKRRFSISQTTLYRRRSKRELPYVKDKGGIIWYPLYDLLDYILKAKATHQKAGRPRKF